MKGLDDVFHRTIIALERLETFLEIEKNGAAPKAFVQTAAKTNRDMHDDQQMPPERETLLAEVQLQCSALYFQTMFDDKQLFNKTMQYFLNDLLEWYGGRDEATEFNEVEMYSLPIFVSLSRQINSVTDIMATVEKYVVKLRKMSDYSEEEKEKAVMDGFTAFMRAEHRVHEEMHEFEESGAEVQLTAHRRGTALDGYKRLLVAMIRLYDETTPAKVLYKTVATYLPELAAQCPDINEERIDELMAHKNDTADVSEEEKAEGEEQFTENGQQVEGEQSAEGEQPEPDEPFTEGEQPENELPEEPVESAVCELGDESNANTIVWDGDNEPVIKENRNEQTNNEQE